ncbi:MAG: hypothetical protein IJ060_04875 [Oscillospiraceae bacterium]|nr:hypothetical protein [Oscillospiraceae bacterium]
MKHYRRIIAAAMPLLLAFQTGCSNPLDPHNSALDASFSEESYTFPRYPIAALQEQIESLRGIWREPGREAEIQEAIRGLLDEENKAYAINIRAELPYRANWSDAALFEANSVTWEDYCVVDEMLAWTFVNGYRFSAYQELFAPYIDESWIDYYITTSLPELMSSARYAASDQAEMLEDYYDTAYDSDMSIEDSNLECAKLYLEILKSYDLSDYQYSQYYRDYTAEQASEAAAAALEEIVPLCDALGNELLADPAYDRITTASDASFDPFAILKQYAPRISPSVAESAGLLLDEQLYQLASGDNCYDGSYTVCLPGEQRAMMYIYLYQNYSDLLSVTHEFGHFHSDWREDTPVYLQANCIDIAESQSQSMEMLFTAFYPEIFGDDAVFMEKLELYNILTSVTSGLAVGEFEYRVMQNADKFTPEDVLNCYEDIAYQYGLSLEFYEITHIFEHPGYYVSYGVSALPAIQLYAMMQEDFDGAVRTYDKLSSISSFSGEVYYSEAMQSCGLKDTFDPDTFSYISDTVSERIRQLNET